MIGYFKFGEGLFYIKFIFPYNSTPFETGRVGYWLSRGYNKLLNIYIYNKKKKKKKLSILLSTYFTAIFVDPNLAMRAGILH
jgi:hypothetical protein